MEKTIELRPEERIRKIAGSVREVIRRERPDMLAITGLLTLISVVDGSSFAAALISGLAFFAALYPFTLAPSGYDPDTLADGHDLPAREEKGGER